MIVPQPGTRTFIIGAGMAGLAAAVALAGRGQAVSLFDAAAQAGGRCRSYVDPQLDMLIDNGNHLAVSGNAGVAGYLAAIGASDRLTGPDEAVFHFADARSGERWTIRPNAGRLPWWVAVPGRRVPGTRTRDYLTLGRLMRPQPGRTLAAVLPERGPLWQRLLEPFFVSALNTAAAEASADLAGAVVRETLAAGGTAYRPRIAHPSLAAAFVDPALAMLARHGAEVGLRQRLRRIVFDGTRAAALDFSDRTIALGENDRVIVAVPPWVATDLLPGVSAPGRFHAIVNGHFRVAPPPGTPMMTGIIGGTVEWIFAFADRISVTVSAADRLTGDDRLDLAQRLWADVARVLDMPPELPPWQIVKEQRATFAATPEQDALRPEAATRWRNVWLAGDWTATGLPATIEGAIRSGNLAAALAGGYASDHVNRHPRAGGDPSPERARDGPPPAQG